MCFSLPKIVPVTGYVWPIDETPQASLLPCNVENLATKLGSISYVLPEQLMPMACITIIIIIIIYLLINCLVPTCFGDRPGRWRSDAIQ